MPGALERDGPGLVMRGAYTAGERVQVGDVLRLTGPFTVAPTASGADEPVGVAAHSAWPGQPVAVVVGGLARVVAAAPVARGSLVGPSDTPGRAQPPAATGVPTLRGLRSFGVAAEDAAAGRAFWAQLRPS